MGGGCHAGLLLVAETDIAYAAFLSDVCKFGHRYSHEAVDGVDSDHLEGTYENIHTRYLLWLCGPQLHPPLFVVAIINSSSGLCKYAGAAVTPQLPAFMWFDYFVASVLGSGAVVPLALNEAICSAV